MWHPLQQMNDPSKRMRKQHLWRKFKYKRAPSAVIFCLFILWFPLLSQEMRERCKKTTESWQIPSEAEKILYPDLWGKGVGDSWDSEILHNHKGFCYSKIKLCFLLLFFFLLAALIITLWSAVQVLCYNRFFCFFLKKQFL